MVGYHIATNFFFPKLQPVLLDRAAGGQFKDLSRYNPSKIFILKLQRVKVEKQLIEKQRFETEDRLKRLTRQYEDTNKKLRETQEAKDELFQENARLKQQVREHSTFKSHKYYPCNSGSPYLGIRCLRSLDHCLVAIESKQ